MFKDLIIINNRMITITTERFETFDIMQKIFGIKLREEWRPFWQKGWHINLERCDKENDFEWCLEHMQEAEDFFLWHSLMVDFPMENWKAFHEDYLIHYDSHEEYMDYKHKTN